MAKDDLNIVGAILNGFSDGLAKGIERGESRKAAQAKEGRAARAEQRSIRSAEIAEEKLDIMKDEQLYKKTKRAWEVGGIDPVTGRNIPVEESTGFFRRNMLKKDDELKDIKLEEAKIKFGKLREDAARKNLPKISAKLEEVIMNGSQVPNIMDGVMTTIDDKAKTFGYLSDFRAGQTGRAWGELKSALGDEEAIKLHNEAAVVNTELNMAATRVLKLIQGSRPSDFDMKFYLDNMPKITDRPELARKKAEIIKLRFTEDYNKVRARLIDRGYSEEQLGSELSSGASIDATKFDIDAYMRK